MFGGRIAAGRTPAGGRCSCSDSSMCLSPRTWRCPRLRICTWCCRSPEKGCWRHEAAGDAPASIGRRDDSTCDSRISRSGRAIAATGRCAVCRSTIPRGTIDSTAAQLGGRGVDFEAVAASLAAGDPLAEEIVRALSSSGAEDDLYAESAAAFLSMHLLSRHTRSAAPRAPIREDKRVHAAVAIMHDRIADPVTLADIAGEVHLSVFHLVRVFKDATGMTPYRFLTRLRIEKAKRLLCDTDLPIAQIASRCGFSSPGALSTAFVRHAGTRPSAYRNR
jgi:AraC family transcriptional regulator